MKITGNQIRKFVANYDWEARGGTGRGLIDDWLCDLLALYIQQRLKGKKLDSKKLVREFINKIKN